MTSDQLPALQQELEVIRQQRGQGSRAPRKTDSPARPGGVAAEAERQELAQATKANGMSVRSTTPGRRPNGANYIKDICLAGPAPLTTCLWANGPAPEDDTIWRLFRRASLRISDRELRRREARAATLSSDDRERLAELRWEWLQQLLSHITPDGKKRLREKRLVKKRSVKKRLVFARRPCGVCVRVEKTTAGRVVVVAERTVDYEVRVPDDDGSPVQWMNLDRLNAATLELLRAHFPVSQMMSYPAGTGWRTKREPRGWPTITRVIVRLYDYMVPFYARAYRRRLRGAGYRKRLRRQRSASGLPETLACDIVNIVRHELPHLAGKLTARSVRGVVQRYIKALKKHHAASGRPRGEEMFHDLPGGPYKLSTFRELPRISP